MDLLEEIEGGKAIMKNGPGLKLLIYGVPALWALVAILLIAWHGRYLEGAFMAVSLIGMIKAAGTWQKRVQSWPEK